MRPLILIIAAGLLTAGCDKPQEKPARVEITPKPENTRRAVPNPPPDAGPVTPAVPAPSPAEVEALLAEFEALAIKVESLDIPAADGSPTPETEALQKSFAALGARRFKLMAGMPLAAKQELAEKLRPSMQRIAPVLMRHRRTNLLDQLKNSPRPADNVPRELLEPLSGVPSEEPPPAPPAPGDGTPPPR